MPGTQSPQIETLPNGSHPGEGALIGSEGAMKNPTHAQSQRATRTNKLCDMNTSFQIGNVRRQAIPLREMIPFWFAVSSPLLGVLMGLLGAWFVTWLST